MSSEQYGEPLDDLVGREEVKQQIRDFVDDAAADHGRSGGASGLPGLVFAGPPGTGKTTVAGILGQMLEAAGFLSRGNLVVVASQGLAGTYLGEIANSVEQAFRDAKGGVLFVDEAAWLAAPDDDKDGHRGNVRGEILAEIVGQSDLARETTLLILSDYADGMQGLMEANPGLSARFASRFVEFAPYSPDECTQILEKMAADAGLTVSPGARALIARELAGIASSESRPVSGRDARYLFDRIHVVQGLRVFEGQPQTGSADRDSVPEAALTIEEQNVGKALYSGASDTEEQEE
jgi:SpoVK/Ycf46/Vps4 family AAA+-type ATPase